MNKTINLEELKKSQQKTTSIINKIVENPEEYDKEKLQEVVDSMKDLVKLAEAKLAKYNY